MKFLYEKRYQNKRKKQKKTTDLLYFNFWIKLLQVLY